MVDHATKPVGAREALIGRMHVHVERLPKGERYPCSPEAVKEALARLECGDRHLARVKRIRLCSMRRSTVHRWAEAVHRTGTIVIFSVPESPWLFLGRTVPRRMMSNQLFFRYGGVLQKDWQGWWLGWWDRDALASFITEVILPHKVGHVVHDHPRWSERKAERVADAFAGYLRVAQRRRAEAARGRLELLPDLMPGLKGLLARWRR